MPLDDFFEICNLIRSVSPSLIPEQWVVKQVLDTKKSHLDLQAITQAVQLGACKTAITKAFAEGSVLIRKGVTLTYCDDRRACWFVDFIGREHLVREAIDLAQAIDPLVWLDETETHH